MRKRRLNLLPKLRLVMGMGHLADHLFYGIIFISLVTATVSGDCIYRGQRIRNDTVWAPDDCSICVCPPHPLHQVVKCTPVGQCSRANSFSIDGQRIPSDMQSDQAPYTFSFLPSNGNVPANPMEAKETGIILTEGEKVTLAPADFLLKGANLERKIRFEVTEPLKEGDGLLERTDRPGEPVKVFTLEDLNAKKITYQAPTEKELKTDFGASGKESEFTFKVKDGNEHQLRGDTDPEQKFYIRVLSANVKPPTFDQQNVTVYVYQGSSVPIPPEYFKVSDPDTSPQDLRFRMTKGPSHGRLVNLIENSQVDVHEGVDEPHDKFIASAFRYNHDGQNIDDDHIVVEVSDGKHTGLLNIFVHIIPVDQEAPTLDGGTMSMELPEGTTEPVTKTQISYKDNNSTDENVCFKITEIPEKGVLRQGDPQEIVKKKLEPGHIICQVDVNSGHITYTAPDEVGARPIHEFLVFDVYDSRNNTLPNQRVTITVTPNNNLPPDVKVLGPLEVPEGGRERIPPSTISITDPDTPSNDLVLVIDAPPEFGILIDTRKPGLSVTSFPVPDLLTGQIVYVSQPKQNEEPKKDTFSFHVTDGPNNSPVNVYNITILPVNDEPPVVQTEPLYVPQGESQDVKNITLYVTDMDTPPSELVFTLSRQPNHGELRLKNDPNEKPSGGKRLEPGDKFTYQDVLKGLLVYVHDDTKTTEDNIDLTLTDGVHEVPATVDVKIEPEGNEGPRIEVNIGLQVPKGTAGSIDSNVLRATDIDSVIEQLKFTIIEDVDHGRLLLTSPITGESIELHAGSGHNSFIQDDLNSARLQYAHKFSDPAGTVSFTFDLSDPEGNVLPNQKFRILILEDRIPPELINNTGVTLNEKEHVPITNIELAAIDNNSPSDRLRFIITSGPEHGRLEKVDKPGVPVTEFRQGDLDSGFILYNHTSDVENPLDSFTFKVTDGTNEIDARFRITINRPKDTAPTATYTSLRVNQGDRGRITPQELRGEDTDTEDARLVFDVVKPPRHGRLILHRDDGVETTTRSFTMEDIWRNRLIYEHDGGPSTTDTFDFVLTDGTHSFFFVNQNGVRRGPLQEPQEFPIIIQATENSAPTIVKNLGLEYVTFDEREQRPIGIFTHQELQAKDPDTPDNELTYFIVVPPRHGQIENREQIGAPITKFTQEDINRGLIRFVLTDLGTPETTDFFIVRLQDNKDPPNIIDNIKIPIKWSWISFELSEYNVAENAGVVRLVIQKVGNLNQYSLVQCATQPGTATDAPGGDYQPTVEQIQFEEGQDRKTCSITIRDDRIYEGPEDFFGILSMPVYALLREPKRTRVVITDEEDRGCVQFERPVYYTNEQAGSLPVTLVRTGDIQTLISVACVTRPMSARDRADFIPLGLENRITFYPGQDRAVCNVEIVSDRQPEPQEELELLLEQPEGIQLGVINRARIIIQEPHVVVEAPTVRFAQLHCLVREASGRYQFEVLREGADLSQPSSVVCSTEAMSPASASPNEDYVHMSDRVNFAPGQRRAVCSVQIIDDSYYEGNESFHLVLTQPDNAIIGHPSRSTVTIFDTDSEVPTIQFERTDFVVEETGGRVELTIIRTGNVDVESTVRCFTMSRSAQPGSDYIDRPNTDQSVVVFRRGERRQTCVVSIVDDSVFEADEQFYVLLGSTQSSKLGSHGKATVTITNREDAPKIYFEPANYDVDEPQQPGTMSTVILTIIRTGDTSRQSEVRVTTRDANAIAGRDYHPKSQTVAFRPGETEKRFAVEILYDNEREPTETFTVCLDQPVNADIGPNPSATVCIQDRTPEPRPALRAPPIVVSLMFYENIHSGVSVPPSAGYPLVCLTPCDRRHPHHQITPACQNKVSYRWEMATDADRDGNRIYSCIADNTPFTTASSQVLDSIYFAPNCVVRCAVDSGNSQPSVSVDVTISREGVCANPRTPETKGNQKTYTTAIQYNEPTASQFPNTVHIQVTIPHRDGIMPIVSTFPIHNMKLLLSDHTYRSQHVCSNLIANQDPRIKGFLDASESSQAYPSRSALMDATVRGNTTVQLYRHLDLDSCQWKFDANYDMTTLVDVCGGTINPNSVSGGQFGQRAVTVSIPLYVTYVYAVPPSIKGSSNWGSIDHRTILDVSFSYDTALWHDQVRTTNDNVDAKINVIRVRLADNGSLVITIKTQTKFRGSFVMSHPRSPGHESRLIPPTSLPVRFALSLEHQQETYDYPVQTWTATSDLNIRDYTGDYTLELIPCMATKPDYYSTGASDLSCEPRPAKQFILPISFQQANRPLPVVYSLNTEFQLSHQDQFAGPISDAPPVTSAPQAVQDDTFGKGELIHGCVMWNPVQDLKDAYKLEIQRLYVCSGKNGYTPTYEPATKPQVEPQYGCMQPSKNLRHRFLLLDRSDPNHVDRNIGNIDFQADFVDKSIKYRSMKRKRSGIDGFKFKTDPLYELGPGRQWYLQVLYVITSADETTRYRRSAIFPTGAGKDRNGTNMRHIGLKSSDFTYHSGDSSPSGQIFSLTTIVGGSVAMLVVLVLAAMITTCVVVKKRRSSSGYRQPPYQTPRGPAGKRGPAGPTARVRSAPRGYHLTRGGTEV
ncbi:Extracellular matrix protein FRAS1 [Hypsibius exemplaris]|uniref:Extracellular matrix protein FRAS1 n=1 Tax=Hypsibius exemplaris TaxID=2072580 RepID=A0A1W0WK26_HYPEX|nr:Extracellular matrix protein FRAS1 [Hypsibius exemplaris]